MDKSRDKIAELVHRTVDELNDEFGLENNAKLPKDDSSVVYGHGSVIDSMVLVSLIVAVEETVRRELNLSVTLANEKAMSMQRSPFRTLGSLIDYVTSVVDEAHSQP